MSNLQLRAATVPALRDAATAETTVRDQVVQTRVTTYARLVEAATNGSDALTRLVATAEAMRALAEQCGDRDLVERLTAHREALTAVARQAWEIQAMATLSAAQIHG